MLKVISCCRWQLSVADTISNVNKSFLYMRELTYQYVESHRPILLLTQSTPKQLENIKQIAIQIIEDVLYLFQKWTGWAL